MVGSGRHYTGDARRMVAMPLGGIGTGNVALSGTGRLTQWQLHNQGNHLGALPQSLFAIRLCGLEPPFSFPRVLQGPAVAAHPEPAPLVNDDQAGGTPSFAWPGVQGTSFTGAYPYARVGYEDRWPATVALEAVTPFVPLDPEASGLPVADFTFSITNDSEHDLHGWLLGTLQNAVGWDGASPIKDARCGLFGGNVNEVEESAGGTAVVMTNPRLEAGHPGAGSMALWSPHPAVPFPQFDDVDAALAFVGSLKLLTPVVLEDWSDKAVAQAVAALRPPVRLPVGPSPQGSTWSGGLAVPFHLEPGETARLVFVHAWHFPNRVADFDRFGASDDPDTVPAWIGNHYSTTFSDVGDVLRHYAAERDLLLAATREWHDAVYKSSLPPALVDVLGSQPALIRSPTTIRAADGRFFGFEGVLGESTANWNGTVGGSCPLNCTHVWNYEQAVSRLFPSLERSMRETDWEVLQAEEGYLPHRVLLPVDGPQLHGLPIGGPTRPALDGMLGTVLKTHREVRQGAGRGWLERYLPHARRLMDYVARTWDPNGTGVLTGDQPVTHDISLQGANMFVGGLWLAALRSMQELTAMLGLVGEAEELGRRFTVASEAYDSLLWNGQYYSQQSEGGAFDFGSGCLSDQLFGQWWAHQLGLGYLLPVDHVRSALRCVVAFNLRHGFRDFEHGYRVFADADDTGLLICTWPYGGRPEVPIRYADEVWTGVEYQVAAHCLYEGLVAEGLSIVGGVRRRYDGTRRNPYNEIECGDHYSRAMSGWSLLEAWTGTSYDAWSGHLQVGSWEGDAPLVAATGWGTATVDGESVTVRCRWGEVAITTLAVNGSRVGAVSLDGQRLAFVDEGTRARLSNGFALAAGSELLVVREV